MYLYTIQLNSFIKLVGWSCYYSCNQWVVFVSSNPNTILKWVVFRLSKFLLFLTSTPETIHCHMYFYNLLNFTWFYLNNTNMLKTRPLFSKKLHKIDFVMKLCLNLVVFVIQVMFIQLTCIMFWKWILGLDHPKTTSSQFYSF